jgi:hypothetical protein
MAAHDGCKGFTTTGEGYVVQFRNICTRCLGNEPGENVIGATGGTAAKGNRPGQPSILPRDRAVLSSSSRNHDYFIFTRQARDGVAMSRVTVICW